MTLILNETNSNFIAPIIKWNVQYGVHPPHFVFPAKSNTHLSDCRPKWICNPWSSDPLTTRLQGELMKMRKNLHRGPRRLLSIFPHKSHHRFQRTKRVLLFVKWTEHLCYPNLGECNVTPAKLSKVNSEISHAYLSPALLSSDWNIKTWKKKISHFAYTNARPSVQKVSLIC